MTLFDTTQVSRDVAFATDGKPVEQAKKLIVEKSNLIPTTGYLDYLQKNELLFSEVMDGEFNISLTNNKIAQDNILRRLAVQQVNNERKLLSVGIEVPEEVYLLGNIHPERLAAVDTKVDEYNRLIAGTSEPLMQSSAEIRAQILATSQIDPRFADQSFLTRAITNAGPMLLSHAMNHPLQFTISILGSTAVGIGAAAGLTALAVPAAAASFITSAGFIGYNVVESVLKQKNSNERGLIKVFELDPVDLKETALSAGADNLAIELLLKGVGIGVPFALRKVGGVYEWSRSGARSIVDDMGAAERAEVISSIRSTPVSTAFNGAESELLVKNYANARFRGDDAAAEEIAKTPSGYVTNTENFNNMVKAEAPKNTGITANTQLEAASNLIDYTQAERIGFDDYINTTRGSNGEVSGASTYNRLVGDGASTDGGFLQSINRMASQPANSGAQGQLAGELAEQQFRHSYDQVFEHVVSQPRGEFIQSSLATAIKRLWQAEVDAPPPSTAISAEQIFSFKTEEKIRAAANYNKKVAELSTWETLLRAGTMTGKENNLFSGLDSLGKIRNVYNATMELVESQSVQPVVSVLEEAQLSLAKLLKVDEGVFQLPAHADIVDGVINPTGKNRYNSKSAIFRQAINKIKSQGIEKGLYSKLDDGWFPNMWDKERIRSVGQAEFIEEMIGLVDESRMRQAVTASGNIYKNSTDSLGKIYNNIAADQRRVKSDASGTLRTLRGDRLLFFKDGASWYAAHDLFGSEDVPSAFSALRNFAINASDDIVQASFGVHSLEDINTFTNVLHNGLGNMAKAQGLSIDSGKLANLELQFKEAMLLHNGYVLPGKLGRLLGFLKNTTLKGMTAGAFVPAAVLDPLGNLPIAGTMFGLDRLTSYRSAKTILKKMTKAERNECFFFLKTSINALTTEVNEMLNGPGKPVFKSLGRKIFNSSHDLTRKISNNNEVMGAALFSRATHLNKSTPWTKLSMDYRAFLERFGINRADWDSYRKKKSVTVGGNIDLMSARYLINQGDRSAVVNRFAVAEVGSALFAAPKNTRLGRTAKVRTGATVASIVQSDLVEPFANVAYNNILGLGNLQIEHLYAGRFGQFVINSAHVLFLGLLAVEVKKLLRGEKPAVDSRSLALAMMYAGFSGPTGDALIEQFMFSSGGINLWGFELPVAAGAKLIGKKRNVFLALHRTMRAKLPFNQTLAANILQKYTTDILFALLDPEGAKAYEDRLQKDFIEGKTTALSKWSRSPVLARR